MSTRRLSAIMFADIVGYTTMMQRNEQEGLAKVRRFSQTIEKQVKSHNGEVLQFLGDGCLCIFNSAVEAMHAAKNIQTALKSEPKVPLRIGIHIGDIVIQEGNIYGDGVNLASRVESMGISGSILVSERVIHDIKSHPEFEMTTLGKFQFKNVEKPMEVFALANEGFAVPQPWQMDGKGQTINEKPQKAKVSKRLVFPISLSLIILLLGALIWLSISRGNKETGQNDRSVAVLPFKNLSNDSSQEFFSDGITEDILINLSKIHDLQITGRSSSFFFKDKNIPIEEIAKQLHVSHILEGSIRKSGERIRINTELVHTDNGEVIWAESYDRKIEDIFLLQDEVAKEIAQALKLQLSVEENEALNKAKKVNPLAYEYCLEAKQLLQEFDLTFFHKARDLAHKAIEIDSTYAEAYAILGSYYINRGIWVGDLSAHKARELSEPYLSKAKALNPSLPDLYIINGQSELWLHWDFSEAVKNLSIGFEKGSFLSGMIPLLYLYLGELDKVAFYLAKLKENNPFSPHVHEIEVALYYFKNENKRTIEAAQKAKRLTPERANIYKFSANVFRDEGKHEEAIKLLETRMQEMGFRHPFFLGELATSYYKNGQNLQAQEIINELHNIYDNEGSGSPAYFLGMSYANMGEIEKAFEWLEKSFVLTEVEMVWLKMDPLAKPLHEDSRYKDLLDRVGFP